MKTTVIMIFGKTKSMKKVVIMSLLCIATMQMFGQTEDANSLFAKAEELFSAKNYNDALSKLALYENLSNASKEKAQVLKIQIYRELALKDNLQVNNYNNAVEELKKMYANDKKVNAEDLYRIIKEQQEFSKDAAAQTKNDVSSIAKDISIDGIKIGMNVEEIPAQVATNFDWSEGFQTGDNLIFMPKKMGTGGVFNFKLAGIQSITTDARTRRVTGVSKVIANDKYKEKEKTGLAEFNNRIAELKQKYGDSNVTVMEPMTLKSGNIVNMSQSASIVSKSVMYMLILQVQNNKSYSIMESLSFNAF
jgi:hypothetical protein